MSSLFCLRRMKIPSSLLRTVGEYRTRFLFLESTPLTIIRSFSSNAIDERIKQEISFTVSYLVNSCGFSLETATCLFKKVRFANPGKPDSVLNLLKDHGLTTTQISRIVKSRPLILLANAEKVILPKLEFFCSIGFTGLDLARFVSSNPELLCTSLRNQIIPSYDFLKSVLLLDDMVVKALRYTSRILRVDAEKVLAPNVVALREIGVPQSSIEKVFLRFPTLLCCKPGKFSKNIKKVVDMGFCPETLKFIQALMAFCAMSQSTWQDKVEIYGSWGWSADEVLLAFKSQPYCMCLSEQKIVGAMDFLVNVMGLRSSVIAQRPHLLFFSLKNRTIPRGLVVKVLMLKGVIGKGFNFHCALMSSDKCFIEKFVVKYQEQVPQLLEIFQGKISLQQLGLLYADILGAKLEQ